VLTLLILGIFGVFHGNHGAIKTYAILIYAFTSCKFNSFVDIKISHHALGTKTIFSSNQIQFLKILNVIAKQHEKKNPRKVKIG